MVYEKLHQLTECFLFSMLWIYLNKIFCLSSLIQVLRIFYKDSDVLVNWRDILFNDVHLDKLLQRLFFWNQSREQGESSIVQVCFPRRSVANISQSYLKILFSALFNRPHLNTYKNSLEINKYKNKKKVFYKKF